MSSTALRRQAAPDLEELTEIEKTPAAYCPMNDEVLPELGSPEQMAREQRVEDRGS